MIGEQKTSDNEKHILFKAVLIPRHLQTFMNVEGTTVEDWVLFNMAVNHNIHSSVENLRLLNQNTKDTMLMFAAVHDNIYNMEILIDNGANVCNTPSVCVIPIIHLLAIIPRSTSLIHALGLGIDIDTVCDIGYTALLLSVTHECYINAYHLIKFGASLSATINPDEMFSDDLYDLNIYGIFGFHEPQKPVLSKSLLDLLCLILSQDIILPDRFYDDIQPYMIIMDLLGI